MQDTNIEWLDKVPDDWEYTALKALYEFEKGKNAALYTQEYIGENPGEYPVYSGQTSNEGVMGRIDTYDYDVDECLFTTTVGAKVMTPKVLRGKFSLSQNCLIMKKIGKCSNTFIYYLLIALFDYEKALIPSYMQPSLRIEDLKTYRLWIPSVEKQEKIAAFLDNKCAEIDAVISETNSSIEEYKKLKQTIISNTVCYGLNNELPLKDSEIPWIGEIPEHWKVSLIKYHMRWKSEKGYPDEQVLSLYRDYGVIPKESRDDNHNVTSLDTSGYKLVDVGDFVINKMKAWQGSMGVSDYRGIISPAYHICEFTDLALVKRYIHYLLRSAVYIPEYTRLSTGLRIGQWDLGFDDFKNIPIVIPTVEEQREIVEYIDSKTKEIDALIENKKKLVAEMEKYKLSVIYDYSTGKREV